MLALLLRQRFRQALNRVTRGPRRGRQMIGATLTLLFTGGFILLAGLNAGHLVDRVFRQDPSAAVQALPVLLVGVAMLTLVTSLSSAFHHLFLAGDLELLLASPVPPRDLFALKVLEIWRDSLHVMLFQAAALYGFGQSLHLPLGYYVVAVVVGVLLTVAATAIGAILTLALARVRFGESVLGLSRVIAILLFLPVGVLGVPAIGLGRNRVSLLLNQGEVGTVTDQLRSIGDPPTWAPTTWAAHLLLADDAALLSAFLLLATTVVVFAGLPLAFEYLYQGGWERVRFSTSLAQRRGSRPRSQRTWLRLRLRLPLPLAAVPYSPIPLILLKDWRTVIRDPRWRTGTLVSLVALGVPVFALFAGDPFARAPHLVRFWAGMLPVPYLAFLVGSQQGASTLSYEGRNLALLRAAPLGMGRVLLAKLLGGVALVLLVTWAATVSLGVRHDGAAVELVAAVLAATWLAVGATLAAVAGAALTADFDRDNPQRRVGCLGTLVTSSLSIFFFVSNTGVLAWWIVRSLFSLPRFVFAITPAVDWGLPLLAVLSVATILVASRFGMQRLAAWETS